MSDLISYLGFTDMDSQLWNICLRSEKCSRSVHKKPVSVRFWCQRNLSGQGRNCLHPMQLGFVKLHLLASGGFPDRWKNKLQAMSMPRYMIKVFLFMAE